MILERKKYIVPLAGVRIGDVSLVGGKGASLGEMLHHLRPRGVRIPSGYIVTTAAFRHFLHAAGLEKYIARSLAGLDTRDLKDLAERGKNIRRAMMRAEFPVDLKKEIAAAYRAMEKKCGKNIDVAVRSSAVHEDLVGASFAGEHDTYLGVRGASSVEKAVRSVMASLFTDRAISYRQDRGIAHRDLALAVVVQQMVRADKGASGVMFTLDPESGFRNVIVISSAYGLGEMVVQGRVVPDEFLVSKKSGTDGRLPVISKRLGKKAEKMVYAGAAGGSALVRRVATTRREREEFSLSEREAATLAEWGIIIERHYSGKSKAWMPMDIEWAKDGLTGELFILQARPETVQARRDFSHVTEYVRREEGKEVARGIAVGSSIASGRARVIGDLRRIAQFRKGEVLVVETTGPDWEPVMKIASAIVTDKGGRTSHAAIVARELGVPAIVGASGATKKIKTGQMITADTTGGDGVVYEGALKYDVVRHDTASMKRPKTKITMNIATPDAAFAKSFIPNDGVGLLREEFIIASHIGIHPLALLHERTMPRKIQDRIDASTRGWKSKTDFYIDNLAYGIAKISLAFYPRPVIVRFSDFKTNEYRHLLGGEFFEPEEENPMIGWRGASRYYDPKFKSAFMLECKALMKVREKMGMINVIPMVPFCRTPEEGKKTLEIMADAGLITRYVKKKRSLAARSVVPVYVMCEIPSNVLLAEEFLKIFDGMSIGSNDLTQLILGVDRDSSVVSSVFDENNPAVRKMIKDIIGLCRKKRKYIGICGQAPSDNLEFARFLVREGIGSISLNPDTVIRTTRAILAVEKQIAKNEQLL